MKEYGGYLPLELREQEEYFKTEEKNIYRLNCGRSAIALAVKKSNWKKIFIPIYMCYSVLEMCKRYNIPYELYHINDRLEPINVTVRENEGILIANYFGIFSDDRMNRLVEKYKNVIVDNTQSFFSRPNMNAYNVYSCRKFIGVSDGAYLIKKNVNCYKNRIEKDISSDASGYLLKALDRTTNEVYPQYLRNEKVLEEKDIKEMSESTRRILKSVNYDDIMRIRVNNYNYLQKKLSDLNEFKIVMRNSIPMIYPLVIKQRNLRRKLVENKIYVSQWWKWILDKGIGNSYENDLSEFLYPLPIDQRYNEEDMEQIARIVLKILN